MGLHNDCWAKIWSCRPYGQICYCQVSVSQKDKQTGSYKNLFSRTVSFAGAAANKVKTLGLAEKYEKGNSSFKSVKITNCDINTYYNTKKLDELLPLCNGNQKLEFAIKDYCNQDTITVWDFEVEGAGTSGGTKTAPKKTTQSAPPNAGFESPDDEEGLPFDV